MKHHRRTVRLALLVALGTLAVPAGDALALDLPTVFRQVAEANPMLASRRAMAGAVAERVGPAGAWPDPMVELAAENVPESGVIDQDPMTMQVIGVSQRVPLFGRTGLAKRSAREAASAETSEVAMAHFQAYGMAWESYGAAYHASERRRIAEAHQGIMTRMVQSARARYEAGPPGRIDDVLRAEAERARNLVDIEMFRSEERAARARLAAVRGIAAGAADTDSLAAPPSPAVPSDPTGWLAALTGDHPQLRGYDARVRSERHAANAARRVAWPDVEVGFSWGFREPLVMIDQMMNPPVTVVEQQDMWTARVAFMLPIFAASREFAEGRERDAMADAAQAERRAAELDLLAEIGATHAEAAAMQRTVGLLADTVVVTQRRALDASWSAYSAGTADLWRTLEAAHSLYTEQLALSRAREALGRAHARFLGLTGRGDMLGVELPPMPGGGS
jgi:outer membrane protein TolC